MHVLIVFRNGGGILFMSFYTIMYVHVYNLHNPHHTGHIENRKQHTAYLQLLALFISHLVLVQFFGSQTQVGWWCVLLGLSCFFTISAEIWSLMVEPLELCHLSLEVVIKAAVGRKPSSQ